MRRVLSLPFVGPGIATLAVALLVASTTDRFLTPGNLNNLALQVSIVALVAIGSTVVIIAGGIDLSPGSAIALLTMLLAMMLKFWGFGFWPAIVLALAAGAAIGAINGTITAYLRIPPFITTLAGLSAYRGMAFMFNNGSPVFEASDRLEPLFYGRLLGIPLPLLYIVLFFAAAHWLMRRTRLGRSIYAVGGNANAARLSGIKVHRVQLYAFTLAGLMAAVAAVLMAARLNSGSPNYGVGLELQAIAAAVIGGASLAGGRGDMVATLFGALTVTIVQNGLNLNAVATSTQNVVIGVIIVLAVGIDMWRGELSRTLVWAIGPLRLIRRERQKRRKAQ
ncbi:MAG: ABC transporter permease [Phyllobacterium sp.]|jgi:ribose transport system permease protein|uniref:ABC transporter permease n=1 Tax=Phyllobacterium sp. TaxID=1871046 RepID=UPI0030F1450A